MTQSSNPIFVTRVSSDTQPIADHEATIADLRAELSRTVAAYDFICDLKRAAVADNARLKSENQQLEMVSNLENLDAYQVGHGWPTHKELRAQLAELKEAIVELVKLSDFKHDIDGGDFHEWAIKNFIYRMKTYGEMQSCKAAENGDCLGCDSHCFTLADKMKQELKGTK